MQRARITRRGDNDAGSGARLWRCDFCSCLVLRVAETEGVESVCGDFRSHCSNTSSCSLSADSRRASIGPGGNGAAPLTPHHWRLGRHADGAYVPLPSCTCTLLLLGPPSPCRNSSSLPSLLHSLSDVPNLFLHVICVYLHLHPPFCPHLSFSSLPIFADDTDDTHSSPRPGLLDSDSHQRK